MVVAAAVEGESEGEAEDNQDNMDVDEEHKASYQTMEEVEDDLGTCSMDEQLAELVAAVVMKAAAAAAVVAVVVEQVD